MRIDYLALLSGGNPGTIITLVICSGIMTDQTQGVIEKLRHEGGLVHLLLVHAMDLGEA